MTTDSTTLQVHAIELAKIALRLPYGKKEAELNMLYSLPQKFSVKQDVLTAAAIAGEIIPVSILCNGLQELLEEAKKEPWRLMEYRGELMGWLELFPFSNNPIAVIEAINSLPAEYQCPWKIDHLLRVLGDSPPEQALQVLLSLADRDPQIMNQDNWLEALFKLGTEDSAFVLLNLICEAKNKKILHNWRITKKLAQLAQKFPLLLNEILQHYEKIADQEIRFILEVVLVEIPSISVVLALIRSKAASKQNYDDGLEAAIQKIAIGQRPIDGSWFGTGAYKQFSQPLADFRKQLFTMVQANDEQSILAEKCLIAIDEWRDRFGCITDEPKHPDISVGKPWPIEAIC